MKQSLHVAALMLAAVSATDLSAGLARAAGKAVEADPNAKVEYNGTISVLTKFGLQQLSPYFVNLAAAYEKLHPGVKVELIQESDDSVKGKTKTLVASNSLPDIYFSWTGSWGENFVRGNRAVDLTKVIGPGTEWGKALAPAAVKAFEYNGKNYGIPALSRRQVHGLQQAGFRQGRIERAQELRGSIGGLRRDEEGR